MPTTNDILAVILGGGRGSRLYPLTKLRSKPAVPIAGKYRLIDVPISNCINSNIYKIAVLTQFNSVSLHRHIARTYNFDAFHTGWVQIWAAQETLEGADWYQGSADAVRKQLFEIQSAHSPYTLVLAGDHLYHMDYSKMADFHWDHNADITVAVQPVTAAEAPRLGILKRDASHRLVEFAEKPNDPALLQSLVSRDDPEKPFLGSMGIYLFRTEVLTEILTRYTFDDFGSQVIPHAMNNLSVYGFDFTGYWVDIGTIRSFYDTNLMLARSDSAFDLYDPEYPIFSHPRFLPGSRIEASEISQALIAEGCQIAKAHICNCVIGLRSQIGVDSRLDDTIVMGSDYYDGPERTNPSGIPLGIGPNCDIEGAIIDKNARIGAGTIIRPFSPGTNIDTETWFVRDGIVVIPKNTTILPGTIITPAAASGQ
jgi:glucose-1-phosphate adenylyltransferase